MGEIVWNQRRWLKDPGTSLRVARANDQSQVVTEPVPELRIIDQALWDRAQVRLQTQRAEVERDDGAAKPRRRFWEQKRPSHLLTGRVFCGECATAFQAVGRDYLACRVAIAAGPCGNKGRVRRGPLEARILDALASELMSPELVAVFVEEFTAEWNQLAGDRSGALTAKRRELAQVDRKVAGLIDAIADGLRTQGLRERLEALEARQAILAREIADEVSQGSMPRLHPGLADVYRTRVAELRAQLPTSTSPEIREALRALILRVEVHPADAGEAGPRIELIGHLAALLRVGGGDVPAVYLSSVKVDAGTRNRRCHYRQVKI